MSDKRLYPSVAGSPAHVPDDLTKIRDAADARNLPAPYVRRLVDTRRIPSWKVGKYRFVSMADFDRFLAAGFTPAEAGGAA